jgi:2-phospho-L-lactate/phosphoenolpyruvate guanylyltransferase
VPRIVVPFKGSGAKRRLATIGDEVRSALAFAMLGDVLAACTTAGETVLVSGDERAARVARELGARMLTDPGGGQAAAVAAALDEGPALVVNADLPCVVPPDLASLLAATPQGGLALVAARDGTTNALSLATGSLFASLYGPGSAARFRAHAIGLGVPAVAVAIANLAADVDTLEDIDLLGSSVGPRTREALALLQESA